MRLPTRQDGVENRDKVYYSQTEAHWFSDPQKTYESPRPISTSMKIMDYIVFYARVFVFSSLGTEQQQSYSTI